MSRKDPIYRPTLIRAWRKRRGLTQEQLLARIDDGDMTPATLSRLENGRQLYTQRTLEMIARALDCRPADLIATVPETSTPTQQVEWLDIMREAETLPRGQQEHLLRTMRFHLDESRADSPEPNRPQETRSTPARPSRRRA